MIHYIAEVVQLRKVKCHVLQKITENEQAFKDFASLRNDICDLHKFRASTYREFQVVYEHPDRKHDKPVSTNPHIEEVNIDYNSNNGVILTIRDKYVCSKAATTE